MKAKPKVNAAKEAVTSSTAKRILDALDKMPTPLNVSTGSSTLLADITEYIEFKMVSLKKLIVDLREKKQFWQYFYQKKCSYRDK